MFFFYFAQDFHSYFKIFEFYIQPTSYSLLIGYAKKKMFYKYLYCKILVIIIFFIIINFFLNKLAFFFVFVTFFVF